MAEDVYFTRATFRFLTDLARNNVVKFLCRAVGVPF
jgi:hypothetical protein